MQIGIHVSEKSGVSDERLRGQVGSLYITRRKNYTAITKVIAVKVPITVLRDIEELVEKGYYQNVSDFVREAIRRLLAEYKEKGILSKEPKPELGVR